MLIWFDLTCSDLIKNSKNKERNPECIIHQKNAVLGNVREIALDLYAKHAQLGNFNDL